MKNKTKSLFKASFKIVIYYFKIQNMNTIIAYKNTKMTLLWLVLHNISLSV